MRVVHAAIGCLAVLCSLGSSLRADMILQYTFPTADGAGNETGPGLDPTTVHPNLKDSVVMGIRDTSSKVTLGTENTSPNYSTAPVLRVDPDGNANSAAAAIANGVFFSFSFEPDPGFAINLSSLEFVTARGGSSSPRGWALRSSLDGYASTIAGADVPTVRATWTGVNVDLSAALFQNITGPATFRFYVYAPSDGNTIEFDNITLNGTVVPEPGTWWLLAVGVVVAAALGRSRSAGRRARG